MTGPDAKAVQRCGNLFIREKARHLANYVHGLHTGAMSVLTHAVLREPQLRVPTARPVNQQNNLSFLFVDIGDDLANQDSDDALFKPHVCGGRVLNGRQVVGQTHEQILVR